MIDKISLKQKGFQGFLSFARLIEGGISEIPSKPGVYVVVRPEGWKPKFKDKNPGGRLNRRDPTVGRIRLAKKWVEDATVLYVGKVGGTTLRPNRTLNKRVREFISFGIGKSDNHYGGRLIWQLRDADSLLVAWRPADKPRELEKKMILALKETYGKLPFANWRS